MTGSGHPQGIGHAIAVRLAEDGFDVAVNDISSNEKSLDELVKKIQGKGRRSTQIIADVSQEDQVKGMVETVVRELGGLDVVCISSSMALFGSDPAARWSQTPGFASML